MPKVREAKTLRSSLATAFSALLALQLQGEKLELPEHASKKPLLEGLRSQHMLLSQNRLSDLVSAQSFYVLELVRTGRIPLHLGRKSLLLEMRKEPTQLAKDLPRTPKIRIGNFVLPTWLRRGRSAEMQFYIVAKCLEKYVQSRNPALVNKRYRGRIGQFFTSEILYGIVQNFSAPAVEMAYEDAILKSGEWAAEAGEAEQEVVFLLERARVPLLNVTFVSTKALINMVDPARPNLRFVTKATLYYYLESGEVNFIHSYALDDRGSARIAQSLSN